MEILFFVLGIITLIAALLVALQRNVRHAALFLAISCLGVAGLLYLLQAPVVATTQLVVYGVGIAALIRFSPRPLRQMTRPDALGPAPRWWGAALVAVALGGILIWGALAYPGASGAATDAHTDFILPLIVGVILLPLAMTAAVRIGGRR